MESVTTLTTIRSISPTDHITDLLPHLPLRRIPLQKRSRQRVIDILGTGTELLLTHGTEGVTTSSVSEHAAIPIGSVYQFFPDRDALLLRCSRSAQRELGPKRDRCPLVEHSARRASYSAGSSEAAQAGCSGSSASASL